MRDNQLPNNKLGQYLKQTRERLNESLAEVSGAVEIDIETLQRIEIGVETPSEDILILLMSYLDVEEVEARKLLQLAGYGATDTEQSADDIAKQIFMLMPFNPQIMYADDVELTVGKNGLVLSFTQPAPNGQPMPVLRIGISKELAKNLASELMNGGGNTSPKLLNSTNDS